MVFLYYTAVLCCFIVLAINYNSVSGMAISNGDQDRLTWAPITSLKYPFVTFINDFNHPTWATRHQITKENGRLYLNLAKNVPFTVVCGACFHHSIFKPNLTVEISDHHSTSIPKRKRDKSLQYSVGVNECMMTFLVTEPIKKGGEITCTLNRGKQVIRETIKFSAVDVDIQQPPEEYEIRASSPTVMLQCPDAEPSPSSQNPVVNVWHEETKETRPKDVGSPMVFTNQTIYLERPKHSMTIVCSVYNIFSPSVVHQRRYKVQGRPSSGKPQYFAGEIHAYEEMDAEILPPRISLSTSILAIIIMAAVVCVLIALIGAYRFFSAFRGN